jgi:hypothetical protein
MPICVNKDQNISFYFLTYVQLFANFKFKQKNSRMFKNSWFQQKFMKLDIFWIFLIIEKMK